MQQKNGYDRNIEEASIKSLVEATFEFMLGAEAREVWVRKQFLIFF